MDARQWMFQRVGVHYQRCTREVAAEMFEAIVNYKRRHDGNAPSVRQLCAALGYSSPSGAHAIVEVLIGEGWLVRGGKRARYLCVPGGSWRYIGPEPDGVSYEALDAFDAICDFKQDNDGNSPTAVEVAELCEFSSASIAHAAITELLDAGLLSRPESHTARRLEVKGGQWLWSP